MTTITEGIVARHLDHLHVRNMRPTTIYGRSRALARLTAWAGGPVLYLTEATVAQWQADCSRRLAPGSLRAETSHVREFYRWCVRDGYRTDDPTLRLDMPRVQRRLPRPIADIDLARGMNSAVPELAAILGLAAFAGMRACEIARLDWSEVGIGQHTPQVRIVEGKGGHGRLVPLSPALIMLLVALPHRRGPVIRRGDGKAGPCAPHRISSMANDFLHSVGIADTLHQHRHRFATATYRACTDIRAVQDLLGHASPTTTAIYAAVSPGVAVQAVLAAGFLAA